MEDASIQSAAFDAVAEMPQQVLIQEPQKQDRPLIYMEKTKKNIFFTVIALIIILFAISYIPFEMTNRVRLFVYGFTVVPAAMLLGYSIAKHRALKN